MSLTLLILIVIMLLLAYCHIRIETFVTTTDKHPFRDDNDKNIKCQKLFKTDIMYLNPSDSTKGDKFGMIEGEQQKCCDELTGKCFYELKVN